MLAISRIFFLGAVLALAQGLNAEQGRFTIPQRDRA
jgi:hypothetical protein